MEGEKKEGTRKKREGGWRWWRVMADEGGGRRWWKEMVEGNGRCA